MTLVLAAAALLSISQMRPLFDSSVQPGGLIGTLIARALASGLNTVGATVLLLAIACTGLLLATNFSFVGLYEKIVQLVGNRFEVVHSLPARFAAWREARRETGSSAKREAGWRLRLKRRQLVRRCATVRELTPAERVAEFMKEPEIVPPSFGRSRGNCVIDASFNCRCCGRR